MATCPEHPDMFLKQDPQGLTGCCFECDRVYPLCQVSHALHSCLYLDGHEGPHRNLRGDTWYGTN